jgi:hypothetical protein
MSEKKKMKKRIGKYIWMCCVCLALAIWSRATNDNESSVVWMLCSMLFVIAGYHRMDVAEDAEDKEHPHD